MMFRLTVETCGNPDFGQDPSRPFEGHAGFACDVRDFAHASAVLSDWRDRYDIGGGNLSRAELLKGNEVVARLSYNGKVWPPELWHPGQQPLYNPCAEDAS